MDIVDIAVEELQFEYSLFDSFFNEFPEPAMEDGYIPYDTSYERDQHVNASSNNTNNTNNSTTDNKDKASSTSSDSSSSDEKKPKMYDVNKHREDSDTAGFMQKIESFFKMVFEMITRAITNIKAKFTRAVSGQKTFAKEMEKLQKNKKPNFELKCKNYLYNDNIINRLYTSIDKAYVTTTKSLEVLFNHFQKVKDDPNGFNATTISIITDDGGITTMDIKDASEKGFDASVAITTFIGNDIGIKGQLGGEGEFFNAVRKMFRGSDEPVEFQLKAKPGEYDKAFNFIKNYEKTVQIYTTKLDQTEKNFKKYQMIIARYKNADIPKSEGRSAFNRVLNYHTKTVTFICSCYTFIVSLLQERLLNCRNLIRRAYGKI